MRCLTLNACKMFCTNLPGCHPPFSYSRRHTLSDYVGGPLCQSGHGYPFRYVRPAAALQVSMVHTDSSDVCTSDVSVIRRQIYVCLVHLAPGYLRPICYKYCSASAPYDILKDPSR